MDLSKYFLILLIYYTVNFWNMHTMYFAINMEDMMRAILVITSLNLF